MTAASAPAADGSASVEPAAPAPVQRVEIDITRTAILKVLGTLAGLWLLAATWRVILWVLVSLLFVATFTPLVRRFQQSIKRPWAIAAVVFLTLSTVGTLLAVTVPVLVRQVRNLTTNLPAYLSQGETALLGVGVKVDLDSSAERWSGAIASNALAISMGVANTALSVLTIFILTIYLLIEGPKVATGILSLVPRHERLPIRRMFGEIGDQVGAYMRGQLLTSAIAGAFALVTLTLLGVPDALAFAVLMMVADVIPLVGPLIGTIPAVLVALGQGVPTSVCVLVAYLIYFQVEGNLIVPRVYGRALKLSPLVVLLAFLLGTTLMGMLGAVLALPVAASIPIVARYLSEWRERLDAERSPPSALP